MQGVVRQHPEATQPPESSVEPLGTAGERVGRLELLSLRRPAREFCALSAPGQASSASPLLQGHVEESVELSPPDGESQPGGFVEESVQGVVLRDPGATQPPESSVESLSPSTGAVRRSEAGR